jgi:hypothetical protein
MEAYILFGCVNERLSGVSIYTVTCLFGYQVARYHNKIDSVDPIFCDLVYSMNCV